MNETPLIRPEVLLVEDDALTAAILTETLERVGATVQLCVNGKSAVQFLKGHKVAAVVLDLMLPELDGVEVLRLMRKSLGHMLTPVVVVTALLLKTVEAEVFRLGAKAYLEKKDTSQLAEIVERVLTEASKTETLRMDTRSLEDSKPAPRSAKRPPGSSSFN